MAMHKIKCSVKNPKGVHCRVATRMAEIVQKYQVDARIKSRNGEADCGSVLDILSLGLVSGSRVVCTAAGKDAEAALCSLHNLLTYPKDP